MRLRDRGRDREHSELVWRTVLAGWHQLRDCAMCGRTDWDDGHYCPPEGQRVPQRAYIPDRPAWAEEFDVAGINPEPRCPRCGRWVHMRWRYGCMCGWTPHPPHSGGEQP